jgi:hypothetical protein
MLSYVVDDDRERSARSIHRAGRWEREGGGGAVLLIAVGIDFAVTGAIGYCPLYARLHHVPRSLAGGRT